MTIFIGRRTAPFIHPGLLGGAGPHLDGGGRHRQAQLQLKRLSLLVNTVDATLFPKAKKIRTAAWSSTFF
jgi:hypothetical protein